jgi:hypothetical protein
MCERCTSLLPTFFSFFLQAGWQANALEKKATKKKRVGKKSNEKKTRWKKKQRKKNAFEKKATKKKSDYWSPAQPGVGVDRLYTRIMSSSSRRPALPPPSESGDDAAISMQQMDTDYYSGYPSAGIRGLLASTLSGYSYKTYGGRVPIMRLFGVTEEGHSVLAHVHGYEPYFYVRAPPGFVDECKGFASALEAALQVSVPAPKTSQEKTAGATTTTTTTYVRYVELCSRQTIWQFQAGELDKFLRVVLVSPQHITAARNVLESGINVPGGVVGACTFLTYESNVSFVMRYMVDAGIVGASWVTLPG